MSFGAQQEPRTHTPLHCYSEQHLKNPKRRSLCESRRHLHLEAHQENGLSCDVHATTVCLSHGAYWACAMRHRRWRRTTVRWLMRVMVLDAEQFQRFGTGDAAFSAAKWRAGLYRPCTALDFTSLMAIKLPMTKSDSAVEEP